MITLRDFIKFRLNADWDSHLLVSESDHCLVWIVEHDLYQGHPDQIFQSRVLLQLHKHPPERSYVAIRRVSNGDFVKDGIKRCACSVAELHEQTAASLMESYFREPR